MSTTTPPRGLYLITPDSADDAQLLARTRPLLDSGAVTWLQYRNKSADEAQRRRQAEKLLPLCQAAGVPLIINDDLALARALGINLRAHGYDVTVVHDGKAALDRVAHLHPAVVILDLGLPVMDGYELASRLRQRFPVARLVAITGYGQDSDRRRSLKAGFAVHLTKPVTVKEIVAAIEG